MSTKLFEAGASDVVYLVDLSSYLLRAYHAIAPLSSPAGEPTHAIHGTVTMLERLYRERQPRLLGITMDAGRQTFRKEIFADYKANRPSAPDDLRSQIDRSEQIVRASGLCVFKQTGVEADDLIASICHNAVQEELRVVIVGADKDLMQLVSERVVLWDTLRNKVFGPAEVKERFGVEPAQLGDLLALMGDTSDNIPGVPSVGPKTAATLLREYGDLDGVFAHVEEIKRKKLKETLIEHEEDARLSRRLVELKSDCPVVADRTSLAFGDRDRVDLDGLVALYEELGFTRQLGALRSGKAAIFGLQSERGASDTTAENDAEVAAIPVSVVRNTESLDQLVTALSKGSWTFETHTAEPQEHRGQLVALSLTNDEAAYYVPFLHEEKDLPTQLEVGPTTKQIFDVLEERSEAFNVHDVKRAIVILAGVGVPVHLPQTHDTSLAAYLLDPDRGHDIQALGNAYGVEVPSFESVSKIGRKKRPLQALPVEEAAAYAGARLRAVHRAAESQRRELEETGEPTSDTLFVGKNGHKSGVDRPRPNGAGDGEPFLRRGLAPLFHEVEMPLARVLARMELTGVLIDTERLQALGRDCQEKLEELEKQAHECVGKEFNVNSPRQLETILFDELGLKSIKRTKTSRSTDAKTLEALSEKHPLPDIILQIRQISKLKGTYIDALPLLKNEESGRIHGAWEQAVAATGRISSTEPNLQNIPIRSELGRKIRSTFVAPPGHRIVSADYSQIELRVLAHLSRDERLLEAFGTNQDIHLRTAMEIFEVPEDQVTKELRTRAKAVNFGVIYGQGESGLAKALGIERKTASSFIAAYFRRYEGVRTFMDETLEKARQGQAVQSILGRRRMVPDIKSGNRARRLAAERIAMNMPIQGSAADILKLAMLQLAEPVTPGTKMVLTVHDELVFEVPETELDDAMSKIGEAMENAYELAVPLEVSVGSGENWNDAH